MLRNAIVESKHEINKLKMQNSDMGSLITELEREISDVEAVSKRMTAQWAKACEIVAKRKRENDEGGVFMREKKVMASEENNGKNEDEDRSEVTKEATLPSSVEGDGDDHSEKSKAEELLGDYLNDWKRILLEGDEVCGGGDGGGSEIAKDFQEFITQSSSISWM